MGVSPRLRQARPPPEYRRPLGAENARQILDRPVRRDRLWIQPGSNWLNDGTDEDVDADADDDADDDAGLDVDGMTPL